MTPEKEAENIKGSVRILLSQIIDYAGLFPPSQLPMSEAVLNYATYRNSNYGWMLGRFVVPAARLDEFLDSARDFVSREGKPWQLAVVAGEDINETLRRIADFNKANAPSVFCDVLEVRANTVSKIENTVKSLPEELTAYFEIAMGDAFVDLVTALGIRYREERVAEHEDEGIHVRMDVAEHPHDAGAIEPH